MGKPVILACRSPKSKGVGYWDGAFIYYLSETKSVIALFKDNQDYIGNNADSRLAQEQYQKYLDSGWTPMNAEDIYKTAGIST